MNAAEQLLGPEALARHGDPNHAGLPEWAPYTLPQRQTMVFADTPRMQDDPRRGEGDDRAPVQVAAHPAADANRETAITNFLGALAQTEAAMEVFRAQGHGHLVRGAVAHDGLGVMFVQLVDGLI